jgi:hypothetical protein
MSGLRLILVAAVVFVVGACATKPKQANNAFARSALAKELDRNWYVLNSRQSLRFLPIGYAEDAPTTASEGEWVYVGQNKRMRWFIPHDGVNGISRDLLHEQATEGSVALQVVGVTKQDFKTTSLQVAKFTMIGIIQVLGAVGRG